MKIKTQNLIGPALDRAVAKCKGIRLNEGNTLTSDCDIYAPSTDWAQGGPIIEQEGIRLHRSVTGDWWASPESDPHRPVSGPSPLIAAMRCYVASNMGEEVDVTDDLA